MGQLKEGSKAHNIIQKGIFKRKEGEYKVCRRHFKEQAAADCKNQKLIILVEDDFYDDQDQQLI